MENNKLLPMYLQFFAEGDEPTPDDNPTPDGEGNPEPTPEGNTQDDKQSAQELLVEIAKLKRKVDKASSEAADYKKKWKDSMTEQEKISLEKAEAQAAKDAEFEDLKKRVRINDLTENFMDLGYSKDLAKKAATAQAEGDTEALLGIQKQFNESQKKAWEAEFYKSMPQINAGVGATKTITKEQFDAMSMTERTKLYRENKAEYDRLIAL